MKQYATSRDDRSTDQIWLLQHPPVYTLGQAGKREHILTAHSIPVIESDRGGQVTYHGPGQLIAYLMIDFNRKQWHARELVSRIELSLIELLSTLNIVAHSRQDAPGVYTEQGQKIASLGLRLKQHSSYHGLALNVDMDLSPFDHINPCGYPGMQMTHIKAFQPTIEMKDVEQRLCQQLQHHLEYEHCQFHTNNAQAPQQHH